MKSQPPSKNRRRATAWSAQVHNKCEFVSPLNIVDSICAWPVKIEHYNDIIGTLADPAHREQVLSMLDEDPANKCLVDRLRKVFKPRRAMVAYATAKLGRTVDENWHCPEAQTARLLESRSPDVPVWDAACPVIHPGLCRTQDALFLEECIAWERMMVANARRMEKPARSSTMFVARGPKKLAFIWQGGCTLKSGEPMLLFFPMSVDTLVCDGVADRTLPSYKLSEGTPVPQMTLSMVSSTSPRLKRAWPQWFTGFGLAKALHTRVGAIWSLHMFSVPVTNIGGCKWQTLRGDEDPILPLLAPVLLTQQPLRSRSAPAAAADVAENIASDEEVDGSQFDALFQVDSEVASQAQPSCSRAGIKARSFKTVAKAYIMGVDDNFFSESDLSDGMTSPDSDLSDADAIAIPKIAKPKKQGQKTGKTPGSASADPAAGPAAGVGGDVVDVVVAEPSSATAPAPAPAPLPAPAVRVQGAQPRRPRLGAMEPGILETGRMFRNLQVRGQFAGWSLECRTCRFSKNVYHAYSNRFGCEEAQRRLLAWEMECPGPGEWEAHKEMGGILLVDFA